MNKLIYLIALIMGPLNLFAQDKDSSTASFKLSLRYILNTEDGKKTSQTVKSKEMGSIPVSMNMTLRVSPFLLIKSPIKGAFFVYDARFHQDRTSSEFGIGYELKKVKIHVSYGMRLVRKKEGGVRSFSSSYGKKEISSLGVSSDFKIFGFETSLENKISYEGNNTWFYQGELRFFPFEESGVHLSGFYESYFGSGAGVAFRSRNKLTDFYSGYLIPERRSERKYKRTQGVVFSLTHKWQ